jgi:phage/plasmid-like protein (TIGR03299 family)
MSHDLDTTTGAPAMAYVGEAPWHGLGEKLELNQPIETWVKAARLDWQLDMLPVAYSFGGKYREMERRYVLARSDTGDALSVVSGDYLVVQPREVLGFYKDLVKTRSYTLETAGSLDGGRKVWALARTGLVAGVGGNDTDKIGAYLLLATSCDKTLATTVSFTSVRVVCQNTLHFAVSGIKKEARRHIKVNHDKAFNPDEIKAELGLIDSAWETFRERLNQFALRKVNDDKEANNFFAALLLTEKERDTDVIPIAKSRELQKLMSSYRHSSPGSQLVTAKNTVWGLLNAVTHYVDHTKVVKGDRMDSAWFGTGAALKEKAFDLAMAMCGSTRGY